MGPFQSYSSLQIYTCHEMLSSFAFYTIISAQLFQMPRKIPSAGHHSIIAVELSGTSNAKWPSV